MLCHALHVYKNKIEKKKRINFDVEENTRQMDRIQSKEEAKNISASNKHEYVCI